MSVTIYDNIVNNVDIDNNDKILKLKKILKRIQRIIKYRLKIRRRCNAIISKLTLKRNQQIELKNKCILKIDRLKERKNVVRKYILKRQRIKYLVRKRRLERLKLMGQFKESIRKIYLKEFKSEKKRKRLLKQRAKKVHPQIRQVNKGIEKLIEKRNLADQKQESFELKIQKVLKTITSLNIRSLKTKAVIIRILLTQLKNPDKKSDEQNRKQQKIIYKESGGTKILKFHVEKSGLDLKPLPARNASLPLGFIQSHTENEPRYTKRKIFLKSRKKTKIEEPLPIGDKRDNVEEKAVFKRKKKHFRHSRKTFRSDIERNIPTSDSDANVQLGKRVLHKHKVHKRHASKIDVNGSSTEPTTSLITTSTDDDSVRLSGISEPRGRVYLALPRTRLSKRMSGVYDNKYFQHLVKTQKHTIREKIKLERRKKLLELQKQQESARPEKLNRESLERKEVQRKSVAIENDQLDKLLQLGLQSNFIFSYIIPSETAVITEQILEIANTSQGVNVRDMLPSINSRLKNFSNKLSRHSTNSAIPQKLEKKQAIEQQLGKEQQLYEESNESQQKTTDKLIPNIIIEAPALGNSKDIEDVDVETTLITQDPTPELLTPSDHTKADDIEQNVNTVCSACGMTNMIEGPVCHSFKQKKNNKL